MARCVKCGGDAADPVWAAYADPAFNDKPPAALALHQECFDDGREIDAARWVAKDGADAELVVTREQRYVPLKDAAAAWAERQIERAA